MSLKFKIIRSDVAFTETVRALESGVCSLLLERSSMGDRLFVVNHRGESIGLISWETRPPGCPHAAALRKFMVEHAGNDGLWPGMSQTYAIGPARPAASEAA
jgi:hypothetical protein